MLEMAGFGLVGKDTEVVVVVVGGDDGDAAADDSLFVNASSSLSLSIQRRQPMKLKQQRQST